jgi:hypothetical protein
MWSATTWLLLVLVTTMVKVYDIGQGFMNSCVRLDTVDDVPDIMYIYIYIYIYILHYNIFLE